jgi:hypothetical protein
MTKTRDGVVPRSGSHVRMPPGSPTPRLGIDEQQGTRGGHVSEHPVSPGRGPSRGWVLIQPAHNKGEK